jgi:hydroxylamine dehydrogenase
MSFRGVFIAVVLATALIVAALLINARRPASERTQPSAALVEATGKCAECHRRETSAIVHQYETSQHAAKGINCLECHRAVEGQASVEHRGFQIAKELTSKNCAQCHTTEYEQFVRSRHAAPSWAAVGGGKDFSPEQRALGERFHKGWVDRAANPLVALEGASAAIGGCNACHGIGRPNADGSFGTCTQCHARHAASVAVAREPTTCGQCHMGPDHSQIEIYSESKHGVLFRAERASMRLDADPLHLTTADMSVPTCSTCHMSGLEGARMTHDTTERLSYFLFAPVSQKRPHGDHGQLEMKDLCLKCHTTPRVDTYYENAEAVLLATNEKVQGALAVVAALRAEGLLTPKPFDEPIEFTEFDLWHYFGRTAKHGAFMGGADFVQWHGNYELLRLRNEIDHQAEAIRARAKPDAGP